MMKTIYNFNFLTHGKSGKCLLVNACKLLANKIKNNRLCVDEINVESIDSQMFGMTWMLF